MGNRYYNICRANIGRLCTVRIVDGRVHSGRITNVTPTHLQLTPVGRRVSDTEAQIRGVTADGTQEKEKGEEVLFPFFIPFAAIVGLSFIAASAALPFRRRPFFGRRFLW